MPVHDRGLIVGKFMPPTMGHAYLIEQAAARCTRLTVVSGRIRGKTVVPIAQRCDWLRAYFGESVDFAGVDVDMLDSARKLAFGPSEDFRASTGRLRRQILDAMGGDRPDCLFGSEYTGRFLAQLLACDFEMVDLKRRAVPISASQVRADPIGHWDLILPPARPAYVAEFVLVGSLAVLPELRAIRHLVPDGVTILDLADGDGSDTPAEVQARVALVDSARDAARGCLVVIMSGPSWARHGEQAMRRVDRWRARPLAVLATDEADGAAGATRVVGQAVEAIEALYRRSQDPRQRRRDARAHHLRTSASLAIKRGAVAWTCRRLRNYPPVPVSIADVG